MNRSLALGIITLAVCGACLLASAPAAAQTDADVARVLKKFEHEPAIKDVHAAALRYALIDYDQMQGWETRARIAHIIPGEWRGRYDYQKGDDERLTTREDLVRVDPDDLSSMFQVSDTRTQTQEDDDLRERYSVQADWDLNKLIFNDDELDVARAISSQVKTREQILITVTKLYYERRRLQVEALLRPSTDATEQVKTQLRIDELTADIDALTGGWFSDQIK